ITPTDPEGKEDADTSTLPAGAKYYQLTHDYLVPRLRDWLTRTRRGRAELLLADRTEVWNARPENRQVPSLLQWMQIRWLAAKERWTPPQRKMVRRATRYHALRGLVVAVVLFALTATGWMIQRRSDANHAAGLVQSLLKADTAQVPDIIDDMAEYRQW